VSETHAPAAHQDRAAEGGRMIEMYRVWRLGTLFTCAHESHRRPGSARRRTPCGSRTSMSVCTVPEKRKTVPTQLLLLAGHVVQGPALKLCVAEI